MFSLDDPTPTAEPVTDSRALGLTAVTPDGTSGTVRLVYRVDALDVALLTCRKPDTGAWTIYTEPLDLLAVDGRPARVPEFAARRDELCDLEFSVLQGKASEQDVERYKEARSFCTPYLNAAPELHWALIEQVKAGDRVLYPLQDLHGTVVDPDTVPGLGLRTQMLVRLDQRHLDEDRLLREQNPDGLALLPTPFLIPTLGLL
ncbi:hypothetical protein [Streptacidiphilus sp. EB103A]|uniref:hypothetical protein n=1 Tax=Streptacidiphilus sp. EB103A TaxID=3156275 RepID=UPI003519B40F